MSKIPKNIWVLFSESDGEYVYFSEKEAKKTKKRWEKEDEKWHIPFDVQGPFKYTLEIYLNHL